MADWRRALWVEHKVAKIISDQESHGVLFNLPKAKFLIHRLTEDIGAIDRQWLPKMPKVLIDLGPVNKPFLKSGGLSAIALRYLETNPGASIGGPFTRIEWEPWDFAKTGLFKEWLLSNGWIPTVWNEKNLTINPATKRTAPKEVIDFNIKAYMELLKGDTVKQAALGYPKGSTYREVYQYILKKKFVPTSPKITEDSFNSVNSEICKAILGRMVLSHRRSLLEGLCKLVREDGRISARANPCATPTARMRHSGVVNIPAPRSPIGKDIRSLFVAPNGYRFVGYDASALELRMFAHYLNNKEFTNELLQGDIHTRNQVAAGLPTRDDAKTFIYAFLYGAGNGKLGEIVGGGPSKGKAIREAFLEANPGLQALIDRTQEEAEKGYLTGLDGRNLWMRKDEHGEVATHKALNTLLQAAGAIVMKWAMVILDTQVKAEGLRAYKVLDMHDEGQWECHKDDVPRLMELMNNCVRLAGEYLGMNCPLASEAKCGNNWYDTH